MVVLIVIVCKGGSGTNRPEMFRPDLGSRWYNTPRYKYVFIIQIKTSDLSFLRNKILECFYHLQFKATHSGDFWLSLFWIIIFGILKTCQNKFWPTIYEGYFSIRKLVYLVFVYIYPQDNDVCLGNDLFCSHNPFTTQCTASLPAGRLIVFMFYFLYLCIVCCM